MLDDLEHGGNIEGPRVKVGREEVETPYRQAKAFGDGNGSCGELDPACVPTLPDGRVDELPHSTAHVENPSPAASRIDLSREPVQQLATPLVVQGRVQALAWPVETLRVVRVEIVVEPIRCRLTEIHQVAGRATVQRDRSGTAAIASFRENEGSG